MLSRVKKIVKKSTPSNKITADESRINELAYFINLIKNGTSVYLGNNTALTRIFTGQKMYVDTRDVSLAPHLLLEGEWEPRITDVFRRYIQEDSIVFDIGANFGFFSLMAGTANSAGSIHAFEANPNLTPLISKSLSVNGLAERSFVNNLAITDVSNQKATISVFKDLWGSATLHTIVDKKRLEDSFVVKTITIDDYCKQNKITNVDVIKLDIEGYEDRAYDGMRKIVKSSTDIKLFIEFTYSSYSDPGKFFETMSEDFQFIYAIDENTGATERVKSLEHVISMRPTDWVMLLCSKTVL